MTKNEKESLFGKMSLATKPNINISERTFYIKDYDYNYN